MKKPGPYFLVLTDKYAPHAGGTATCWTEWTGRWDSVRCTVITCAYGQKPRDVGSTTRVRRVPFFNVPKLRMPLVWLFVAARALLEVAGARPTHIFCGQVLETGWIGFLIRLLFGIPYSVVLYGEELVAHAQRPWSRSLQNLILGKASGVAAITHFTSSLVRTHTTYRGEIRLVCPGVDLSRFKVQSGSERSTPPFLVTVGRLMRRKGHDLVIRSLPRLLDEHPDLTYKIVGTGPEEGRLKKLVQELGLERHVSFLGRLEDQEIVSILNQAKLFVHPNRQLENGDVEGFGIVFLEANSCGLPVIGGNSGGAVEAISNGHSGILVDPNSSDELIQAISRLLTNKEEWNRISHQGIQWAASFNWDRSAQILQEMGA